MEEPVFIKCEPGLVSGTAELNKTDPDVKLPTEEQTQVKIEPEDKFYEPIIKEEIEIQDMKLETCDEENDISGVSSNENQTLPACLDVPQATYGDNQMKDRNPARCFVCGKWFTRSSTLRQHIFLHTGEKPHKCEQCGRAFAQDRDVKLPIEEQTDVKTEPEEPFIKEELEIQDVKIEPYDEENNASVVSLNKNHTLPAHHKLQPATCGHNKSPYQSATNVKQILVVHSGQKPHQLAHSGQKNYICLICGGRFSVRGGLKSHLSTHSEDKPYKCLLCGNAFERKQCLKRHMNVHATPGPNSNENAVSQLKILKRPFYINK